MKTKKQLQEAFRAAEARANKILEAVGDKEMSAEQRAEFSEITTELEKIQADLDKVIEQERGADQTELRRRFEAIRAKADEPEEKPEERATLPGPRKPAVSESRSDYHRWPVADAGEFFRAARSMCIANALPHEMNSELRATMEGALQHRAPTGQGTLVDADGGFLVPSTIASEILQKVNQEGQLLSRVTEVPITVGNSTKWNAVTENARTSGNRYGGITVERTGEGNTTNTSKAKIQQVALELKKLTAGVYFTEEQLEDGPQITSLINTLVPKAFTFKIESEIWEGAGAGQMEGINNSPSMITVAIEAGQTGTGVIFDNIVAMWSRLHGPSRANSAWFINQDTEPSLMKMSLSVGTGGIPVYLPANGLAGSPFGTLMGRPVIPIEHASTVGTPGDIVLADMSQYLYATKGGLKTAQSIHVNFLKGETVARFVLRNDGKSWWPAALTPAKGSNTQSPFVRLAARS